MAVERLGLAEENVVPLRTASRAMPRAWTAAIEHGVGRLAALRDEVAALVAQNSAVVASIPPAAETPDPRPLIEETVRPVADAVERIAHVADSAAQIAQAALRETRELAGRPVAEPDAQVLTVFKALSRILAVRVLLFLALAGSFALAVMAMLQQSWLSLALVVGFALLTVAPFAWLEIAGRSRSETS